MPLKTSRLLVAIIPGAVFAFFLASVFATAIRAEFVTATLVGVGAAPQFDGCNSETLNKLKKA